MLYFVMLNFIITCKTIFLYYSVFDKWINQLPQATVLVVDIFGYKIIFKE